MRTDKHARPKTTLRRGATRTIAVEELVDETLRLFQALRRAEESMHSDGEIQESERGVLFTLFADGPQSVPALARMRGRTRQRMLQVVNRLSKLEYVRRLKNPVSDKSPLHALTPAGRTKVTQMLRKERKLYSNLKESLTPRRLQSARSVLRDLRQEIDAFF